MLFSRVVRFLPFLPSVFLAVASTSAQAEPVSVFIPDPSFESSNLNDGSWTNLLNPWQETDGPNHGSGFKERIDGFSGEGTSHLGMLNGHAVWQTLAAIYQPNTRYTLTVAVGHRRDLTNSGNESSYSLAADDGTVFANNSTNASLLPEQTFADAPPLVFDTTAHPEAVGQPIRILLEAEGGGRSHFDNIRLTAVDLRVTNEFDLSAAATPLSSSTANLGFTIYESPPDLDGDVTLFWGTENRGNTSIGWDNSFTFTSSFAEGDSSSIQIADLVPATGYFATARATSVNGDSWAEPIEFQTPPEAPMLGNGTVGEINARSAQLTYDLTSTGGETPTVTLYYGLTDGGTTPNAWEESQLLGPALDSPSATISDLPSDTEIFFRFFAENSGGGAWSPTTGTFTTLEILPPTLATLPPSGITGTSASLRGEVTDTGNETPEIILYFGTFDGGTDPAQWQQSAEAGQQDGAFTHYINDLAPETAYYYRAYAFNSAGGAWASATRVFQTGPVVSVNPVINEFHYNPDDRTVLAEFIELHNPGDAPVDLSGWSLSDALDFTFPNGTVLEPGDYLVVAEAPQVILDKFGVAALGPWEKNLSSDGETILLEDASGDVRDRVDYGAGFPWPSAANGRGSSAELLHPRLDNNLGGSWRSSESAEPKPAVTLLPAQAEGWRYRKGVSESSDPTDAWRNPEFDVASWLIGQAGIGYGATGIHTELPDMRDSGGRSGYSSLYLRREFTITGAAVPDSLLLRFMIDDGCVIWINGQEVLRRYVPSGELLHNAFANVSHEQEWEEVLLENAEEFLIAGTNVVAVHGFNINLTSSDFVFDMELRTLPRNEFPPTPGSANSNLRLLSEIPPHIEGVEHQPMQPTSGEPVTITATITDPDGVADATLLYQVVEPGQYIRKTDAAYETAWTSVPMTADETTFTATIPASAQNHRNLIRYRIDFSDALGNTARAPYSDDEQPNFAYYVYDGLPAWTGAFDPGETPAVTYPPESLGQLPVYTLIGDDEDILNSQYNPDYKKVRFLGTFVYNGTVYDHIEYRNRGEGSTYVSGKNKWRFYFHRCHELQAHDNYGRPYNEPWRNFSANAGASPWAAVHRGMAGVEEAISYRLYQLAGHPSPSTHFYHFRVVRGPEETPPAGTIVNDSIGNADGQYTGDFWGVYLAVESIRGSFLDERELPDGNIYKIENNQGDKKRQAQDQVTDASDWDAFHSETRNTTPDESWWRENMDTAAYNTFHAINRLIGNVDVRGGFNHYFYRRSTDLRWVPIPWDLDMMFIAKSHWTTNINGTDYPGVIHQHKSLLTQPALALEYRNRAREILDLMATDPSPTGGQFAQLVSEYAAMVHPSDDLPTPAEADAALWNLHPRTEGTLGNHSGQSNHRGNFFWSPYVDSRFGGTWTRWLRSPDFVGHGNFDDFMDYLRDYSTNTFPADQTWQVNNGDQRGYGYQYLQSEAADPAIPAQPTLTYTGDTGFPANDLRFASSPYSSPVGQPFAAAEWRIAEIAAPGVPGYVAGEPWRYEIVPTWESGEQTTLADAIHFPVQEIEPGHTYRARVRHRDTTGRWSHWSEPVTFVAGESDVTDDLLQNLVISEIHYHPADVTAEEIAQGVSDEDEFEFIEFHNTGDTTLDLTGVSFTDGIDFAFPAGTLLAPGAYTLAVGNATAFAIRYGDGLPIAGTYPNRLANSGEQLTLSYGALTLRSFAYSDDAPWPTSADGDGPSLLLLNPQTNPDHANPANWTASPLPHGTPGRGETLEFTNFEQWRAHHFDPDDPDGSPEAAGGAGQTPNLLRYAMDLAPSESPTPDHWQLLKTPGGEVTFRFLRDPSKTDLRYRVEASDDLIDWSEILYDSIDAQPNSDGTHHTITLPATAPRKFLRLRILLE